MKRSAPRKIVSLLLVFALILLQCTVTAFAAEPTRTLSLSLSAPEGVKLTDLELKVYEGFTLDGRITDEVLATLTEITPVNGVYPLSKAGTYSCFVQGKGVYSVMQLFNVTKAELAAGGTKKLEVETGKIAGNGYEPSNPAFTQDARDQVVTTWPDEILRHFSAEKLPDYDKLTTPAFSGKKALNEFTSQKEMMDFIKALDGPDDNMYVYSLGKTPKYGYDIPLILFTSSPIPKNSTLEQAAKIVGDNGKPMIWQQAQIHSNEPASGEGALLMIREMDGSYGAGILPTANVAIIPRINPDGAVAFTRINSDGIDMNRDHMALYSKEIANLHYGYQLFMPELTIDNHEFTYYGANGKGYMNNADDLQMTAASSLNNDAAVNARALRMVDVAHQTARNDGIRVYHYGTTVNNPIGRAYYGLYNSVSVLIETRGIGAGRANFERRVLSQVNATKSLYKSFVNSADAIEREVSAARASVIAKGRIFDDQGDLLALYQTKSGNTLSPTALTRIQYNMDGSIYSQKAEKLSMNDTVTRGRVRPTAYVLDKREAWLEKALYILDGQGAEYYSIAPGSAVELEQYYYIGDYTPVGAKESVGIEAGLRTPQTVSFPKGAVIIPLDQTAGNVIAMLMEPDVNDSNGYNGSLYQYGLVSYDAETFNFPLYRFTGNDPRAALPAA